MITKWSQKRHFKQKIRGIQKAIWSLEFDRFKTAEIREEVRKQYDNVQAKLSILKAQLESDSDKPSMEKKQREETEMAVKRLEEDSKRHQAQMDELDTRIHGAEPTEENPEGVKGINQDLESFRELQTMLSDYIKII